MYTRHFLKPFVSFAAPCPKYCIIAFAELNLSLMKLLKRLMHLHFCFVLANRLQSTKSVVGAILGAWKYFLP